MILLYNQREKNVYKPKMLGYFITLNPNDFKHYFLGLINLQLGWVVGTRLYGIGDQISVLIHLSKWAKAILDFELRNIYWLETRRAQIHLHSFFLDHSKRPRLPSLLVHQQYHYLFFPLVTQPLPCMYVLVLDLEQEGTWNTHRRSKSLPLNYRVLHGDCGHDRRRGFES